MGSGAHENILQVCFSGFATSAAQFTARIFCMAAVKKRRGLILLSGSLYYWCFFALDRDI